MQLLANGKQQFIDANGAPLASGKVYFYAPSTLTPATTYQDAAGTIPNTNPVNLDSAGQAVIWGNGTYRQVVKDSAGNQVWDQIAAAPDLNAPLAGLSGASGSAMVGYGLTNLAAMIKSSIGQVVASIAALKLIDHTKYTQAVVTGYYASGDGGGGVYYYDSADATSTDNGGTIIVASDGGRWKMQRSAAISVKQFGAKGDGTTDDTAAFQRACDFAALTCGAVRVPSVAIGYRLTASIIVSASLKVIGESVGLMTLAGTNLNTRGAGSWLYFNHAGRGFQCNDGGLQAITVSFEEIGTYRDQPTPSGASPFTPSANDYDFYLYNCDARLTNFATWNATKGILSTANATSSQSRLDIDGWRGQPLQIGLHVEFCADVTRTRNVHLWPYWSFAAGVTAYMTANAIAYYSGRNDNPLLNDFFTYAYAYGVQVYNTANGSTHKLKANNVDFDYAGRAGLQIGAGVSVFSAQLNNLTIQGASDGTTPSGIIFDDASFGNEVFCSNVDLGLFSGACIYVGGTANNVLRLSNTRFFQWNGGNSGAPAISVRPNNFMYYDAMTCEFTAALNGGLPLGTAGSVTSIAKTGSATLTTDASGLMTLAHNLGRPPTGVIASSNNTSGPISIQLASVTSTAVTLKAFTAADGAPIVSGGVAFTYILFY